MRPNGNAQKSVNDCRKAGYPECGKLPDIGVALIAVKPSLAQGSGDRTFHSKSFAGASRLAYTVFSDNRQQKMIVNQWPIEGYPTLRSWTLCQDAHSSLMP